MRGLNNMSKEYPIEFDGKKYFCTYCGKRFDKLKDGNKCPCCNNKKGK